MSIQSLRKELQALKREVAPGYKTIEELIKSYINSLSDHELYQLIRHATLGLKNEVELTNEQLQNMSDEELMKILK